jgi:PAS domain S-box-containing protein
VLAAGEGGGAAGVPLDALTILESTSDSVYVLDREWRFIYHNARAAAQIPGGRELVGRSVWEAFPEATTSVFWRAYHETMEKGVSTSIDQFYPPLGKWFETNAYKMRDGGIAVFFRDISEEKRAGQELNAAHRRSAEILESISDAFYALDGAWRFTYVNRRAEQLWGRSRDELLGRVFLDAFPQAEGSAGLEAHRRAARERRSVHLEAQSALIGKWLDISIYPSSEDGLTVYFRDITERKRAEQALKESEARLRFALDVAQLGTWELDAITGKPQHSRQHDAIFGYADPQPGFGYSAFLRHVVPEDREHVDRVFRPALKKRTDWHFDCRIRRADGELRWISMRGKPMVGENGEVVRLLGIVADITENRRAEEVLRESEERLRIATEAADIGTWDYDPASGALKWSPRCKALFGLAPDAAVDYGAFITAVHPEDRARLHQRVQRALDPKGGGEIAAEFRITAGEDGALRWISMRGRARFENGRAARFIGTALDVTQRKEAEAEQSRFVTMLEERVQERTRELAEANAQLIAEAAERHKAEAALAQVQRMEAIGHLTGGVAHDFNNLLTVIAGNLDMIDRKIGNDEGVGKLVAAARRGAERGAQLTSQLLAFARRATLRPEVVCVNELLGEFQTLIAHAVGEAVEIDMRCAPGLWSCHVDPAQFQSAILNLVVNAGAAMPKGGALAIATENVTLGEREAALLPEVAPGPYVRVSIADTGVGIAADVIDHIFEPFFTTKEIGKGTGLGLAQVYGFVRQSGGTVTVESAPGAGTAFTIFLPRAETTAVASPPEAAAAGGTETILVVEDDEDVLGMVLQSLACLGYRALVAHDAPTALDVLRQGEPVDLVFTDIVMPRGMSGIDLAEEVHRLRPQAKVLFTSGYAAHQHGVEKEDALLLAKPYRQSDLAASIRAALDHA